MADIYNQATWWSAVKPDAATDAVWDQEIARQAMTPIERAARALADALAAQEPQHGGTFFVDADNLHATTIDGKFDLIALTTAVIAAIRLSDASQEAAVDRMLARDGGTMDCHPNDVWKTMIDALLEET